MGNTNSRVRVHVHPLEDYVESFEIVWLEERSKEILLQDQNYLKEILSLKDFNLRFFTDSKDCKDYLCGLAANAKVLFLVNEQRAENMIDIIHPLCPIKFIFFIHSEEINRQNNSSPDSIKVKHVHLNELASQIHYFHGRFLRNSKEFFSIDIFKANQTSEISSTKINGRFLYTQLLLDILLRMERKPTDKDELLVQCSELFANNPSELQKLQEFHLKYRPDKVFEWYTRDSFIYRQVNRALRTQNIDLLFLYRFFLQDLQSQLTQYQEQSPIRVYRGQSLPRKEWDELSKADGQYVSMNSFLSTSTEQNVAEIYAPGTNVTPTDADQVSVIFQIEANPHLPGGIKPFANIRAQSQFPEENEVLFMAGSIFHVISIINDDSSRIVRMELCSNEENDLQTLFETLRREYGGELVGHENEASLNSFGIVLYNLEKYDIADRFFRRIYHETPSNDPNRIRYCLNIGNAALHTGRYKECARWYDRAFELCDVHGFVDHPLVGNLHLVRGNLYTRLNKRQRALESYNKALAIFQAKFGENHPLIALCYSAMTNHFERRKYYSIALEMQQKALRIAERTLPPMHPQLATYHLTLSQLLIFPRNRDLETALHHANEASKIANRVLAPDDPQLLQTYLLISEIYGLMKDFQQSRFWSDAAEAFDGIQSTDNLLIKSNTIGLNSQSHHDVIVCFIGLQCERPFNGVDLPFPSAILQDHPSTHVVYLIVITGLVLIALVNNIFALTTFLRERIRTTVCGVYLIIFASCSLILMCLFQTTVLTVVRYDTPSYRLWSCNIIPYVSLTMGYTVMWASVGISVEKMLIECFNFNLIGSRLRAILLFLVFFILAAVGNLANIFARDFALNPLGYSVCKYDFLSNPTWELFNKNFCYIHIIIPIIIHLICTICILTTIVRRKILIQSANRWCSIWLEQLHAHRDFFIPPVCIIAFLFPNSIYRNLLNLCIAYGDIIKLRLHIAFVFLLHMPMIFTFLIYIYPSKIYTREFRRTYLYRILCCCLYRRRKAKELMQRRRRTLSVATIEQTIIENERHYSEI